MKKILLSSLVIVSSFAYTNCAACHNGGYKEKLTNYTPSEIINIMKQYKNGDRSGMMSRIAGSMSEEDIKDSAIKFGKK